ncbi:MAG: hypothetical protein AMXMBFR47_25960 [Planctomycetota bacterium]
MRIQWVLAMTAAALASISCVPLDDVFPLINRPIAPRTFSGTYSGVITGTLTTTYAVDGRVETEVVSIPVSFTFGRRGRLQTCTYVGRGLTGGRQVAFDYDEDIGYSGTSHHSSGHQRISNLVQSAELVEYDAEYYRWVFGAPNSEFRAGTHFMIRLDGDSILCRAERVVEAVNNPGGTADPSANFSFNAEWIAEGELSPAAS